MDDVRIFGEVATWPSKSAMARLLSSAGFQITIGRYSLRLDDFDHFVLQEYEGDLGDPRFDFEAHSLREAQCNVGLVSSAFSAADLRHRFEIYVGSETLAGYFHHEWPTSPN